MRKNATLCGNGLKHGNTWSINRKGTQSCLIYFAEEKMGKKE